MNRHNNLGQFIGAGPDGHSCKVRNPADLPAEFGCWQCDKTKPLAEMCVVHLKKEGVYYVRPRCKECHNQKERGHRREYKRRYLQRWRAKNAALVRSYWADDPNRKENSRLQMARFTKSNLDAIAIRRRMNRRGQSINLQEARELLKLYGLCYPTRYGLIPEGLRECERIRKRQKGKPPSRRLTAFQIRLMVYEDGLFIRPSAQKRPYKKARRNLRRWWQRQKQLKAA